MIAVWLKTVSLFDKAEKRKIAVLLACSVLIALIQLAGVASIMPFVAVLTSPDLIDTQPILAWLRDALGIESHRTFLIALGVLSFVVLVVGHVLDLFYSWASIRFINLKEYELSTDLLMSYLAQDFAKVSNRNTAELSKNVLEDVEKVISGILLSGMEVVNSSLSALFIIGLLLFTDFWITLTIALVFLVCYGVIFLVLSPEIRKLGSRVQDHYAKMYITTQQALDGLKEIKAADKERPFARKYAAVRRTSAIDFIRYGTMELLPKQLLELTAFGAVIGISIFFVYESTEPGVSYSIVAMFAFAAYRIVPMVKEMFDDLESFDYYRSFIDSLWDDLMRVPGPEEDLRPGETAAQIRSIELVDVHFSYEGASRPALAGVDLKLDAGERICLVGPSGAGKTTTVDIVLGLLTPTRGSVLVNGEVIHSAEYGSVRSRIGYVPQRPYLLDDTLGGNILFADEETDEARLATAYAAAGLDEIFGLYGEAALSTAIGQHGARLSGGQKQRVAIARALYRTPDLLILDESTNELDLAAERRILSKLTGLGGLTILFVSHRPSVMKVCDRLIGLEDGRIVVQGTLADLVENAEYRALAEAAQRERAAG